DRRGLGPRQPGRAGGEAGRGDDGAGACREPGQRVLEGRRQALVLRADRPRSGARLRLRVRGDDDDGPRAGRPRGDGRVRREAQAALLLSPMRRALALVALATVVASLTVLADEAGAIMPPRHDPTSAATLAQLDTTLEQLLALERREGGWTFAS